MKHTQAQSRRGAGKRGGGEIETSEDSNKIPPKSKPILPKSMKNKVDSFRDFRMLFGMLFGIIFGRIFDEKSLKNHSRF